MKWNEKYKFVDFVSGVANVGVEESINYMLVTADSLKTAFHSLTTVCN